MSVLRIGEIVQPAWSRTAGAIAETGSSFGLKLPLLLEHAADIGREFSTFIALMLSPAALLSLVLGIWRLGADLGWTDQFVISNGFFSHWQVWITIAIALEALASLFSRSHRKARSSEQNSPLV